MYSYIIHFNNIIYTEEKSVFFIYIYIINYNQTIKQYCW